MIKSANLGETVHRFAAATLISLGILIPLTANSAGAVPSLNVSMCKRFAFTDPSGFNWYRVTANFSNLTFSNASMQLTINADGWRLLTMNKTSAYSSDSLTTKQSYRWSNSASASISTTTSGVSRSTPRIADLPNCGGV